MMKRLSVAEASLGVPLLLGLVAISLLALGTSCAPGGGSSSVSTANPTACAITMQAVVVQENTGAQMVAGGVLTAGTLASEEPTTSCFGTATSFSGITESANGLDVHPEVRVNATWDVTWDWLQTAFSSCGDFLGGGFVPDQGATFRDNCQL